MRHSLKDSSSIVSILYSSIKSSFICGKRSSIQVSILYSSIKSLVAIIVAIGALTFQFYIVRLKVPDIVNKVDALSMFQFYIVRLKDWTSAYTPFLSFVSILYSSIKSFDDFYSSLSGQTCFNSI